MHKRFRHSLMFALRKTGLASLFLYASFLALVCPLNAQESPLKPFELHTDIWQPLSESSIFADELKNRRLQGMQAKAGSFDAALKGQAKENYLQGGVSKFSAGSLSTNQRLLRPRLLSGYTMLSPSSSMPDLFDKLKSDIAASKPALEADLEKAKLEMDAELAHPKLNGRSDFPEAFPLKAVNPQADLQMHINKARPIPDSEIELARKQMEEELRLARLRVLPALSLNGSNPALSTSAWELEVLRAKKQMAAELEAANAAMQAELARARKSQVMPELSAEQKNLARARKETEAQVSRARPELEAMLTHMRVQPELKIPDGALSGTQAEMSSESIVNWDKWYANFARLYEPELLRFLKKYGSPEGSNTVSISVSKQHKIEVSLYKDANPAFDRATLAAYRALDGNPALQFPPGSHREKVSFLIDNVHENPGPISAVKSNTFKGDKEIHGYKWK